MRHTKIEAVKYYGRGEKKRKGKREFDVRARDSYTVDANEDAIQRVHSAALGAY